MKKLELSDRERWYLAQALASPKRNSQGQVHGANIAQLKKQLRLLDVLKLDDLWGAAVPEAGDPAVYQLEDHDFEALYGAFTSTDSWIVVPEHTRDLVALSDKLDAVKKKGEG